MRHLLLTLLLLHLAAGCGEEALDSPADAVRVRVGSIALDPRSGTPVVILEEHEGPRLLPIWIGFSEARSIQSEIDRATPPRPNTHDLAKRLVRGLEGELQRVVVTELRGGTFYAVLVLESQGSSLSIDARPSDAIALALRMSAPVFVVETVFDDAAEPALPDAAGEAI